MRALGCLWNDFNDKDFDIKVKRTKSRLIASKKISNKANFFAKRFAAKEAFVKSIGLGFRKGINLKDICVHKDKLGKPNIVLNSKVKKVLSKKFNSNRFKIFLSLSDEKDYSVAYVILNKK